MFQTIDGLGKVLCEPTYFSLLYLIVIVVIVEIIWVKKIGCSETVVFISHYTPNSF